MINRKNKKEELANALLKMLLLRKKKQLSVCIRAPYSISKHTYLND